MLVLTAKAGEAIIITASNGEVIRIGIAKIKNQYRLGFEAPKSVTIDRECVHLRKQAEKNGDVNGNR
jgi:carbon storage regulator